METVQEKTILSEEQGKEILYAATKLAVDKYRHHTLISETDFFAGALFVLQQLTESPEKDLAPYLAGPAFGLAFGRGLVREHFDQQFRTEVDRAFQQNRAMAHYRLQLYSGLKDVTRFLNRLKPEVEVALEIIDSLLEEVFDEGLYDYADED